MSDQIFVLLDHRGSEFQEGSLEALAFGQSLARELDKSVHALVLGADLEKLAALLTRYSLNSVIVVDDPRLAEYSYEYSTAVLSQILDQDSPLFLLMEHSYQNIDLAPRVAARVGSDLLTDCTGFRKDGDETRFVRQMFRGKLEAELVFNSKPPWMITVQGGSFRADQVEDGTAEITRRQINLDDISATRHALDRVGVAKGSVDLSKAEVIVGVGRGLKSRENMAMVEELAGVLKAEIGASRPVVDHEWLTRDRQIGSSGQSISPRLYFALGISGAIQHIVGIKNAGCIVAVNIDKNAPIFNIATYGIVGDLTEIVPRLTQELTS